MESSNKKVHYDSGHGCGVDNVVHYDSGHECGFDNVIQYAHFYSKRIIK